MSTDGTELRDLLRRVERLENQNRWLKRTGVAVVAAVGALLVIGQVAPGHRMAANDCVLTDNQGHTRGL